MTKQFLGGVEEIQRIEVVQLVVGSNTFVSELRQPSWKVGGRLRRCMHAARGAPRTQCSVYCACRLAVGCRRWAERPPFGSPASPLVAPLGQWTLPLRCTDARTVFTHARMRTLWQLLYVPCGPEGHICESECRPMSTLSCCDVRTAVWSPRVVPPPGMPSVWSSGPRGGRLGSVFMGEDAPYRSTPTRR